MSREFVNAKEQNEIHNVRMEHCDKRIEKGKTQREEIGSQENYCQS